MIERMVLFGASGDLTSRLLLPAVAQLAEAELLPARLTVLGSDVTDWSTDDFRQHIAGKLREHASVTPATRDRVVSMLSFQSADVTRDSYDGVEVVRAEVTLTGKEPPGYLFGQISGASVVAWINGTETTYAQ